MDFFTKTKQSILNAGSTLSQKASDVSGTVAVSARMRETEKKLKDTISELGNCMLTQYPQETAKMCPELYQNIQELEKQMEADRKELAVLKGMQICPNCGAEQSREAVYCAECGMNMQEAAGSIAQNQAAPASNVCPNCGSPASPENAFCPVCGAKLK